MDQLSSSSVALRIRALRIAVNRLERSELLSRIERTKQLARFDAEDASDPGRARHVPKQKLFTAKWFSVSPHMSQIIQPKSNVENSSSFVL